MGYGVKMWKHLLKLRNTKMNLLERAIERFIFVGRWVLAPMYVGLIVGELIYVYRFLIELTHILGHFTTITEEELLIGMLSLVDITMIGNLIAMVTIGGYSIFVSEINFQDISHKPRWLNNHISSGTLKIKMCATLIGITLIHLLKSFINAPHANWNDIGKLLAIHAMFLVSIAVLAGVEKLTHPHPNPPPGVAAGSSFGLPAEDNHA
jgi:uncharacterized protein (TIGR00645 family)